MKNLVITKQTDLYTLPIPAVYKCLSEILLNYFDQLEFESNQFSIRTNIINEITDGRLKIEAEQIKNDIDKLNIKLNTSLITNSHLYIPAINTFYFVNELLGKSERLLLKQYCILNNISAYFLSFQQLEDIIVYNNRDYIPLLPGEKERYYDLNQALAVLACSEELLQYYINEKQLIAKCTYTVDNKLNYLFEKNVIDDFKIKISNKKTGICLYCKKPFVKTAKYRMYCSDECKQAKKKKRE